MKNASMKNKVATLLLIAILATICISFLLLPKKGYSDNENRYLTPMPQFSFEALFDGEYTQDFERFVTDGFPLRDQWISLKSRLDLLLGRKDTGGVYVTDDGCLIEMFDTIDQAQFDKNLAYLQAAKDYYSSKLDSFNILLVPTAAEIWKDKIASHTADISQKELLAQAGDLLSVDLIQALEAHKDEYIYYRNDHHWTSLGAYYVYAALMGEEVLPMEVFTVETLSDAFLGTTFSKAGLYYEMDTMEAWLPDLKPTIEYNMDGKLLDGIYDRSYLEKKDKYSVYLSGNQPLSVIRTGVENGKKLLLVKDSYANTFVQFLLPHYEEIHVVDLRSFGMSLSAYAEQAQVTDMLTLYNLKGFSQETSVFRISK